MARKRTEFTEAQKARIYARDRATCAFSGISLWLPDYGIRPNWEMDWVDHIKPSSSGGTADLDNGVCASSTFNAKKGNNASDNLSFFKEGRITRDYVRVFGLPAGSVLSALERRKRLEPADWYFNRAVANTFFGFEWRCQLEFKEILHKRDDQYWFNAAWRRLKKFNRIKSDQGIQQRKLLIEPRPHVRQDLAGRIIK